MTEYIENLVAQNFNIFNINSSKLPIDRNGVGLGKWQLLTYEELCQNHNYSSNLWGMPMGRHSNGRYIMSLDFDCCGKKDEVTKERVGCRYTQDKFNEYLLAADTQNGMFSSSTEGNMNILIDYSNCPTLIARIESLKTCKFAIEDLEVLLGGYQAIPPSATTSKITGTITRARQFLTKEPFYVIQEETGFVYNFINELIDAKGKKTKKTNKINKKKTVEIEEVEEQLPPVEEKSQNEVTLKISLGILDLYNKEIQFYCESGAFKKDVQEHSTWIILGGMFRSIMSPDNALQFWKLATERDGSVNKNNEIVSQFRHIKILCEDPIIAINTMRKNIKKEYPTILQNWKSNQREEQKNELLKIKEQLRINKDKQREEEAKLKEQLRINKAVEKEEEAKIKEQLRINKEIEREEKTAEKNRLQQNREEKKQNKEEQEEQLIQEKEERRCKHTFVDCDNEAIDIIYGELQSKFIYANGQMYFKDGNKWINNDDGIKNLLMKYILESAIFEQNENYELRPYCQNVGTSRNIREGLIAKLSILNHDDLLYDKFHSTTKNKLCFKDGVLDFVNKSFTLWENIPQKTIYTTIIIERNYAGYFEKPDKHYINLIKNDIINNLFGEKSKLALQFFSRAIGGNIQDKNFMSYSGNRNCGKGILYGTFENAFGEYVTAFNLENMICKRESNKSSDIAKENAWLIPLQFARLAVAQETDENENGDIKQNLKISNKVMKSIMSGGDTLIGRALYKDPVKFTIDAVLAFFGNNELSINGNDSSQHHLKFNGVKQFITQEAYNDNLKYGADFVSSFAIRDETLKDKIKTDDYSNAMVFLLFENFVNKSLTVKNDIDDEEEETSVRKMIFTKYEITKNEKDRISKDILYNVIKADKKKIIAELKQIGCVGDCNCKTTVTFKDDKGNDTSKQVQAFRGLKLKVLEVEAEA